MNAILTRNKKILQLSGLIVFVIGILAMAYHLRSIFNPVLLSLLLAYILNPIANFFETIKVRRTLTLFLIYILLVSIITIIFFFLIPLIGVEVNYLYEKTFLGDEFIDANADNDWNKGELLTRDIDKDGVYQPSYIQVLIGWLKQGIKKWNDRNPDQKLEWQVVLGHLANKDAIRELGETFFDVSKITWVAAFKTIGSLFALLSYFVLLPLYTFFLLRSLNDIRDTMYAYLPGAHKQVIIQILQRIHNAVSAFFRGKLIICILKGFLTWGVLELMGVKYALIFGAIQMVASIVPFLVLLVGMMPNLILVALDMGMSWPYLFGVVVLYSAVEALEGFILTPWVMRQETGLHPLTVILSLLVGGKLFGLFGLIIAIPLCNTLKILGQEFILPAWKEVLDCHPEERPGDPPPAEPPQTPPSAPAATPSC